MPRIALGVEYDGSDYCGWQIQQDCRSVQATLERAVSEVADEPVRTVCAGRTDTGVHALAQVVHFDTEAVRSLRSWVLGVNSELPDDVNVCWAREVPESFHARFAAVSRRYRYLILNRRVRSALCRQRAWVVYSRLDENLMGEAASSLVGEHDFSALRASGCQAKSPVRTVHALTVERRGNWIAIDVHANAFLHHMVRNIAGLLVRIGEGTEPPSWAGEVLSGRDRRAAGITAPPQGLYFYEVEYPDSFGLPGADSRGVLLGLLPGCQPEAGV